MDPFWNNHCKKHLYVLHLEWDTERDNLDNKGNKYKVQYT